jgi:hypothetical protein
VIIPEGNTTQSQSAGRLGDRHCPQIIGDSQFVKSRVSTEPERLKGTKNFFYLILKILLREITGETV